MARVTVVNDSPDFLRLMDELLDMLGHEGIALSAPDVTLDSIIETRPDLLVLDLHIAGDAMTGWTLANQARVDAALASVPIVISSGDHRFLREHDDQVRATAGLHVLPKPFTLADVEQLLTRLVGPAPGT